MNTARIGALALGLALAGGAPAGAQTAHDLFQQALVKERAEGDLQEAINLYEQIARDFSDDHALAAKALAFIRLRTDLTTDRTRTRLPTGTMDLKRTLLSP